MSHWFRALLAISYPLLGFVFSPEAWAVGEPVQYDPAKTKNIHDLYERTAVLGDSWIKAIDSRLGAPIFHKNFAVVIGVGDYDYWNHLEAPPYDAVRMRNFLVEQGYDSVLLLTNREASKANIEQYMEDKLPGLVQDNDRVLFYFSGHGTQRALKGRVRGYLPMLNSKPDEYSSMISMEDIERWEQNLRDARHLLFVLDACFSGLAGVEVKGGFPKPATQSLYLAQLKTQGHYLIAAGTGNQESNASLKAWGGSLFTSAFIEGARGKADAGTADFPQDGIVTVPELLDYIRKSVDLAKNRWPEVAQDPQLSNLLPSPYGGSGDFFFTDEDAAVSSLSSKAPGSMEIIENKGNYEGYPGSVQSIHRPSNFQEPSEVNNETEYWERAQCSHEHIDGCKSYLHKYPKGTFSDFASYTIRQEASGSVTATVPQEIGTVRCMLPSGIGTLQSSLQVCREKHGVILPN